MDATKGKSRRGLKICCGVSVALLIVFLVVSIILFFTVFKPKDPIVITHPTKLENVQFQLSPNVSINATIVMVVTIDNRNHGSFKFPESTASVYYRGTEIAVVPVDRAKVPAHGNLTITTYANVTTEKMVTDPNFYNDLGTGYLNFTSSSTMHGQVSVMKIIKMAAKVTNKCNITVAIVTREVNSKCDSKVKL